MKLYLHQKQIENRIHELAHEVNDAHYLDDSPFVMVGILNGGFMVFAEFVKHLNIPIECDFVRAKSYTGKKQGKIEITKDIELSIRSQSQHKLERVFFPKNIISISEFPLTISGKIDRKKLENMVLSKPSNN